MVRGGIVWVRAEGASQGIIVVALIGSLPRLVERWVSGVERVGGSKGALCIGRDIMSWLTQGLVRSLGIIGDARSGAMTM